MKRGTITFILLIIIFACLGATTDKPNKTEPEKCAQCHKDSRAYKEWQKSGHFKSLESLKEASDVTKSCLKCHSADHSAILVSPWTLPDKLPDVDSVSNPISCSACHRHDSGIEHNLILPPEKLCVACHVHFCGG
jgi:nitrate/TMAO reductase-like tetraheme cytochrome c subunit